MRTRRGIEDLTVPVWSVGQGGEGERKENNRKISQRSFGREPPFLQPFLFVPPLTPLVPPMPSRKPRKKEQRKKTPERTFLLFIPLPPPPPPSPALSHPPSTPAATPSATAFVVHVSKDEFQEERMWRERARRDLESRRARRRSEGRVEVELWMEEGG